MGRNEATTCDDLITPKLKQAQWGVGETGRIEREYTITAGPIHTTGKTHAREPRQRADYLLRYKNQPIAIVEAKAEASHYLEGSKQAKQYARQTGVPFAYSTNGHEIEFFDIKNNTQQTVKQFHTPDELWQLYTQNLKTEGLQMSPEQQRVLLHNYYSEDGVGQQRQLRYYQERAITAAIKAIFQGKRRILMSMATGTGKTFTAIQLVYKLWKARHIRRVLFIVDRNILADQAFGEFKAAMDKGACYRIKPGEAIPMVHDLYFAIYQSLVGIDDEDNPTGRPDRFKEFDPDFFDLIVVDEAHRGARRGQADPAQSEQGQSDTSQNEPIQNKQGLPGQHKADQSAWFRLLDYFKPAIHVGLTATPRRDESNDTYAHFNTQVTEYSLQQGIQDGYLAPYIIKSVTSNIDALGYRPEHSQIKDVRGLQVECKDYETSNFERELSIPQRTREFAHHLIKHLFSTDPLGKTIVFCVNKEHALDMAKYCNEFFQAYREKFKLHIYKGDYAVRITGDDKNTKGKYPDLDNFQNVDEHHPIIATTSRLLTTGVDIKNLKNVVIFKNINSWVEFKQIIGRGTRILLNPTPVNLWM